MALEKVPDLFDFYRGNCSVAAAYISEAKVSERAFPIVITHLCSDLL